MTKQEFINHLKSNTKDLSVRFDCCEFFINTYPVKIKQIDPFNPFKNSEIWTKLVSQGGGNIKINGGQEKTINYAFMQLTKHIKTFEDENNQ